MDQTYIDEHAESKGPVECLGLTFENDEARREYFIEKLREKLKETDFRKIEGFPIGGDEEILALSDPPYYTACPNPFLEDFVLCYGKPYDSNDEYRKFPFVADVKEGKNDPIYNAHSYHTKVPHKAIMRYVLHYTEPGDIILDGFCGTGMTGVAAQQCSCPSDEYRAQIREDWKQLALPDPSWGARRAILVELSTAAALISGKFNTPVDRRTFEEEARRILSEVEVECGWLFQTEHTNGSKGRINFTIWSDVFSCSECASEVIFWEVAADETAGEIKDTFPCPQCHATLSKERLERSWETRFDKALDKSVRQAKQVPVVINYSVPGLSGRFEKRPDEKDMALLEQMRSGDTPYWYPSSRMMDGGETRRNDPMGVTHVHHFYSPRNLYVLSAIRQKVWVASRRCPALLLWFTSSHVWATRLNRLLASNYFKKGGGVIGQTLQGTLYISSIAVETNALERFRLRIDSVPFTVSERTALTANQSAETLGIPANSIDYIFTDPPFGANIAYSELNSLWESWLGLLTNIKREAIENRAQGKTLYDYQRVMEACFSEYFRVLKPGRWMTVEFSNTKASVWNAIQTALERAGFIVANVAILEKTHKGYRAVTTPTAVKQDLVISAYKPNGGLEGRFAIEAGSEEGAWDFVQTHLRQLPIFVSRDGLVDPIVERHDYMLFDRMVAFHVQRGVTVPLSAAEFYVGLTQRFVERDGMHFLPEQVAEYDKKRMTAREMVQLELFVTDEATAIQWLKQQLSQRPQTFQELTPQFMKEIGGWQKFERPLELREMLEQNFLCYLGKGDVPGPVHSYLSTNFKELRNLSKDNPALQAKAKNRWYVPDPGRAADLEKLRERTLLKEFWEYLPPDYKPMAKQDDDSYIPGLEPKAPPIPKGKKIKIIRLEAVRVGFKHCWQRQDYRTIIAVAQRIPENVLQEDPKLLMWYDQALTRTEG